MRTRKTSNYKRRTTRRRRGESPLKKWQENMELRRKPIKEEIERLLSTPGRTFVLGDIVVGNPQDISVSKNNLRQLSTHLDNVFGYEPQNIPYFLFLIWMDFAGVVTNPDMQTGLDQFRREVATAIKPKSKRGPKPKTLVTRARELRAQGISIRRICEMEIPNWHEMPPSEQRVHIRMLDDAVRKRSDREKETKGKPDNL